MSRTYKVDVKSANGPLYNLRLSAPGKFQMAKFDSDFNVEAVYDLEAKGHSYTCNCPANNRTVITKPCKHKRMLPLMLGAVNTDRFYNPDTGAWCQPLGDIERPQVVEVEGREALPDVHLAGEALLVEGKDRTATQIDADMTEAFKHGPDASKGLEPLVEQVFKLAQSLEPPIDGADEIAPFVGGDEGLDIHKTVEEAYAKPAQLSTIRRR